MDPNVTLATAREAAAKIQALQDKETLDEADMASLTHEAYELAQALADLDGWLVKGGFPPEPWAAPHR